MCRQFIYLTMKKDVITSFLVLLALIAFSNFLLASAFDPSPLQDTCVAVEDPKKGVYVNGRFCKDPNLIVPDDFYHQGLNIPGNTQNSVGSNVTFVTVEQFPALNTLGISMVRIDYAPYGINPPHYHPRAAEILTVVEGTVVAGFVTANPDHRHFSKVLNKGDVFAFPFGLIHFQYNVGSTPAVAIAALSSQFPGVVTLANTTFGASPPINPDILARSFNLNSDRKVENLQSFFV